MGKIIKRSSRVAGLARSGFSSTTALTPPLGGSVWDENVSILGIPTQSGRARRARSRRRRIRREPYRHNSFLAHTFTVARYFVHFHSYLHALTSFECPVTRKTHVRRSLRITHKFLFVIANRSTFNSLFTSRSLFALATARTLYFLLTFIAQYMELSCSSPWLPLYTRDDT